MADVFEALAAPARRALLDELIDRDGQTLFELCTRLTLKHDLGLTRQAISQHLDVLESAGLVTTERQGRYKFHRLRVAPLEEIVNRWLGPERKRRTGRDADRDSGQGERCPAAHRRGRRRRAGRKTRLTAGKSKNRT